jgi:hypothetical protein
MQSLIWRVFTEQLSEGECVENLDWWTASDGTQLDSVTVLVQARRIGDSVHALIIPLD